ncbi:MAG: transposase [Solirubrobacterales bacterium]
MAAEIGELAERYAPWLFEVPGVARLTAGKLIGCAPIPASSGNTQGLRFDRNGNRQLNATFYRIALTRICIHPEARAYLARKRAEGKTTKEAPRCLKRHLVRTVWRAMQPAFKSDYFPCSFLIDTPTNTVLSGVFLQIGLKRDIGGRRCASLLPWCAGDARLPDS